MVAIQKNPLSALSDSQLIKRLDALVQKERETTLDILAHLIEMDRRSLYLGRGYGSLFEYCTRHLGYSESAASRRIKTARCIRDFPEIYKMLSKNELNLSTVAKLSSILSEENKNILLKEVRCRSSRQVDAIIARYRPMTALRDRVRPVYIKKSAYAPGISSESESDVIKNSLSQSTHSIIKNHCDSTPKSDKILTADVGGRTFTTFAKQHHQASVLAKKYKIEFAVNPDFIKKLDEAKAILSKKYPKGFAFEQLFEEMLDEYLEKHSPKRKIRRRQNRNKQKNYQRSKQSRHIPKAVRDEVFARDESRCTFVGSDGMRCNSTWNLQIDHIEPYAKGGDHKINNLRLLCGWHNRHEAERIYGRDFMDMRMHKRRPKRE